MSFFVYIHTCPNNKKYVGVTSRNKPEDRWCNGYGYRGQKHFYSAIQKYGWDNIKHEYFTTKTKNLMFLWEKILIYHYDTFDTTNGYNKSNGGEWGYTWTAERREKVAAANRLRKGKFKHSEESKKKMSESQKLAVRPKKMPQEAIEKMRASLTGRKLSEAHRKSIGDGVRGKTRSEESRKRYSEAKKLYWENKRKNNT